MEAGLTWGADISSGWHPQGTNRGRGIMDGAFAASAIAPRTRGDHIVRKGASGMGRRAKTGRRTATGRLSRALDAQTEHLEPVATRMRLFGLSEANARDQRASTVVGRLSIALIIDTAQYEAALQFLVVREHYQRAMCSPDALRSSSPRAAVPESEDYVRWCQTARAKYRAMEDAVRAEQCLHENRGANLWAALDYLVVRDQPHWHMVGDLRIALNALVHHFGIVRKVRRATMAA